MYSADLRFVSHRMIEDDQIGSALYPLLQAYRSTGQIISSEHVISRQNNEYSVCVVLPESVALNAEFDNSLVQDSKNLLLRFGIEPGEPVHRGQIIDSGGIGTYDDAAFLVLFTTFLSLESPVRSDNGLRPIPVYRLPSSARKVAQEILSWQTAYNLCDTLQMNCSIGEQFGLREVTRIDSALSKEGLRVREQLEVSARKPVFYYLYTPPPSVGIAFDRSACPVCGSTEWRMPSLLCNLFDCKCDACRLLSNSY